MKELTLKVLKNEPIAAGIYRMRLELPEKTEGIRCGQFINISVGDASHLLRRPIAICQKDESSVTICYQVKGNGTKNLSGAKAGDILQSVLPLGNGFILEEKEKKIALLGGGVGVFPMVSVLQEYAGKGKNFYSYVGFRNKDAVCMESEFQQMSEKVCFVTDDGSYGERGNAVEAFLKEYDSLLPDVIFACGPLPMLRALKKAMRDFAIKTPCYVSLEERMGCGIGACLVCVCKKSGKAENVRVCKDGPVFEINEVEI